MNYEVLARSGTMSFILPCGQVNLLSGQAKFWKDLPESGKVICYQGKQNFTATCPKGKCLQKLTSTPVTTMILHVTTNQELFVSVHCMLSSTDTGKLAVQQYSKYMHTPIQRTLNTHDWDLHSGLWLCLTFASCFWEPVYAWLGVLHGLESNSVHKRSNTVNKSPVSLVVIVNPSSPYWAAVKRWADPFKSSLHAGRGSSQVHMSDILYLTYVQSWKWYKHFIPI